MTKANHSVREIAQRTDDSRLPTGITVAVDGLPGQATSRPPPAGPAPATIPTGRPQVTIFRSLLTKCSGSGLAVVWLKRGTSTNVCK